MKSSFSPPPPRRSAFPGPSVEGGIALRFFHAVVVCSIAFYGLALVDLLVDHYLYGTDGPQDGRGLTVTEKIDEYRDDLIAAGWIAPAMAACAFFGNLLRSEFRRTDRGA